MGLFGQKKASPSGMLAWLSAADDAYSLAFQTKSIVPFQGYVTRDLAVDLIDKIRAGDKAYAGLDRYKHVEWYKEKTTDETVTFIKDVHYDHVKFSHGIIAPVGDDHKERWVVRLTKPLCVTEIRRVCT